MVDKVSAACTKVRVTKAEVCVEHENLLKRLRATPLRLTLSADAKMSRVLLRLQLGFACMMTPLQFIAGSVSF